MRADDFRRPDGVRPVAPIDVETRLLEMFTPARMPSTRTSPRGAHATLWRADAIHRAKNMAQMTVSLANVAAHPSRQWLPPEVTMEARRLSRAYDALCVESDDPTPVPCAALLTEIATRLADIFGRSRHIAVTVRADAVMLSADIRRALVLVASELIINALKYGYPGGRSGTITVSLAVRDGVVALIVEDDGAGDIATYAAGHGGGLLERLGDVLGATVTRTQGAAGHGFCVTTRVPVG